MTHDKLLQAVLLPEPNLLPRGIQQRTVNSMNRRLDCLAKCSTLLERFTRHLHVVVPFSFRQFSKIHKARVLPLVVVTNLKRKKGLSFILVYVSICYVYSELYQYIKKT